MMPSKAELRRQRLAALSRLEPSQAVQASRHIAGHLCDFAPLRQAGTILSFHPLASEPDLLPLLSRYPDKQWGFPVVKGRDMDFYRVTSLEHFHPGTLGVREPDCAENLRLEPGQVDLVLVPGLSFDPSSGMRLGRGKGFYDRYLSALQADKPGVVLVGVCFSLQLGPTPGEGHDVALDHIVTEQGCHSCGGR